VHLRFHGLSSESTINTSKSSGSTLLGVSTKSRSSLCFACPSSCHTLIRDVGSTSARACVSAKTKTKTKTTHKTSAVQRETDLRFLMQLDQTHQSKRMTMRRLVRCCPCSDSATARAKTFFRCSDRLLHSANIPLCLLHSSSR
jgi:hypothetical protein